MKTLALYALLLGAGLMTVRSDMKVERQLFYASLESAELVLTDSLFSTEGIRLITVARPALPAGDKEYHIYYENQSPETIEVAIRYKAATGRWQTKGMVSLSPGEKQLMGLSTEPTYYSYAQSTSKRKKKWKGDFSFSLKNSSTNVDFEKQEIWECYDQRMCNAFTVFR